MIKQLWFKLLLVCLAGSSLDGSLRCAAAQLDKSDDTQNHYESPRLESLAKELDAGNPAALDKFWRQVKETGPLIEPLPDDPRYRLITFIWQGSEKTRNVELLGDLPYADVRKWGMIRFRSTDLWFKTERVPKDTRFSYAIRENGGDWEPDPLNPHPFNGRSLIELPDAPPQHWILERPGIPKGVLLQRTVRSTLLNQERTVGVYTPPGYDPKGEPYGLLVVFDGEAYGDDGPGSKVPMPTILDNLIYELRIPPVVAILVNSINQEARSRDLLCSIPFEDFLAKELVPWSFKHLHTSDDASRIIVAGSSYGGLSAACTALRHPEVFGNVLSQSGTFSYYPNQNADTDDLAVETGWLTRQYVAAPKLPIRFYIEVGRFEGLLGENRRLRDVLEAKGYQVTYHEYSGNHDYTAWRGSFGDGLVALIGDQRLH